MAKYPKRFDGNSEPMIRQQVWNGLPVGITHEAGQHRFSFSSPMRCRYGFLRGTFGKGLDGRSVDVYLGDQDTGSIYEIIQLTPEGIMDEIKLMLGFFSPQEAIAMYKIHAPNLFGGIRATTPDEIRETYYPENGSDLNFTLADGYTPISE